MRGRVFGYLSFCFVSFQSGSGTAKTARRPGFEAALSRRGRRSLQTANRVGTAVQPEISSDKRLGPSPNSRIRSRSGIRERRGRYAPERHSQTLAVDGKLESLLRLACVEVRSQSACERHRERLLASRCRLSPTVVVGRPSSTDRPGLDPHWPVLGPAGRRDGSLTWFYSVQEPGRLSKYSVAPFCKTPVLSSVLGSQRVDAGGRGVRVAKPGVTGWRGRTRGRSGAAFQDKNSMDRKLRPARPGTGRLVGALCAVVARAQEHGTKHLPPLAPASFPQLLLPEADKSV